MKLPTFADGIEQIVEQSDGALEKDIRKYSWTFPSTREDEQFGYLGLPIEKLTLSVTIDFAKADALYNDDDDPEAVWENQEDWLLDVAWTVLVDNEGNMEEHEIEEPGEIAERNKETSNLFRFQDDMVYAIIDAL